MRVMHSTRGYIKKMTPQAGYIVIGIYSLPKYLVGHTISRIENITTLLQDWSSQGSLDMLALFSDID